MVELLRTKLFIPRKRANLVPRPRLVERLNTGLEKKLTLISAPAGFGKTTLLSEWIPKCPRPVTWLFLDEGDNDPIQFWTYFIAALQELHPDIGAGAVAQIQSTQAPPIRTSLTELINDVTAFSDPFAGVLDDYHFVDSQPIHEGLSFLIDHLPANMHLVITTREDPDLPLARLRARDHLTEIRAMDLRFTQEEADAFLRDVMGLALSQQDIAELEHRTEGWAVGLQLAGLSMQNQADPKAFIAEFSGSHRHVLDYLTEEVLQQQPEDVRTFLLQTAMLDRLFGPLCDALTGRMDSDRLLAHLEAANLFVIPLDEGRRWYRYHHLFNELLLSQLTRSQPELLSELHQRASLWFEENGDIDTAVEHALQATDLTLAARLIEQHSIPKLYQGEVARVIGWFDRLPEATLRTTPMLCISKAWALAVMQRGTREVEVERAITAAEQALEQVNADAALRDLVKGHTASIQAFLLQTTALMGHKPEELIALSQQALRLLPEDEKGIRSVNAMNIGYGYLALADLESARMAFTQTLEDGLAGGNLYAAIYGPINLVINALLVGNLRKAMQICDTNIELFNRILAGENFPPIGALYILKGSILLEYDRQAEAEQVLTEGLDLIRWTGEYEAHKKGYSALARLRSVQGNRGAMLDALKTLEAAWPEGAFYAQALRHCLSTRHWGDDPDVQRDALIWLNSSGDRFDQLEVIDSVDPYNEAYFESYICAARVLACLAKEKPGEYPVNGVLAYLERQQHFAVSYGFVKWEVEIAITRSLLCQAAGKKREALNALEEALNAAAPTGLLRTFLDECESLQALLVELKPRLTGEALTAYANQLQAAMRCGTAKPEIREEYPETLSERELEVLRYLATGMTYEETGRQLFLSLNTIQFHVKNIYGKLMVNKRVQAIEKAREMKLI